jgi:hypothetical protein
VVVKNLTENKVLSFKEFFEVFQVKAPEEFLNKTEGDFTLFFYSSKKKNQMGLLVKLKETENASTSLKNWEGTMEKDFEGLLSFLGKRGKAISPNFKDADYKNVSFHYLSFADGNFGICYGLKNDLFLLTFSGESILKTIDRLTILQ